MIRTYVSYVSLTYYEDNFLWVSPVLIHLFVVTAFPWPDPDVCLGTSGEIVDSVDCSCFYHCNDGAISGHECCREGTVFDPATGICNWDYNVPSCEPPVKRN